MWAHGLNALLGIWLMAAPALLAYGPPAATSDRVAGPLLATVSIVAMAQCTRAVRRAAWPIALWLVASPWVLGDYGAAATASSVAVGVAAGLLSLIRGRITREFDGGWGALLRAGACGTLNDERAHDTDSNTPEETSTPEEVHQ